MTGSIPAKSRRRSLPKAEILKPLPVVSETRSPAKRRGDLRCVVLLGMHRSGTSLLAHMLHYFGVDMADETDHASAKNPRGFWERPAIVTIQDQILDVIGRPIGSPLHALPLPAGWWRDKRVAPLKEELRIYVQAQLMGTGGIWGFKDPRTCRLLPLWQEIFEQLDITPKYVWAIRSPGESSASMAKKNPALRPMQVAQAELMWLAYNYDVIRYALPSAPTIVDYQQWFHDPIGTARRLIGDLDLPGFNSQADLIECVRRIFDEDLQNEQEGKREAQAVIPVSHDLYREICRFLSSDTPRDRLLEYVPVLDVVFRALAPFANILTELPALRDANADAATRLSAKEEEAAKLAAALKALEDERKALQGERKALEGQRKDLAARLSAKEEEATKLAAALKDREDEARESAAGFWPKWWKRQL